MELGTDAINNTYCFQGGGYPTVTQACSPFYVNGIIQMYIQIRHTVLAEHQLSFREIQVTNQNDRMQTNDHRWLHQSKNRKQF